jgi:hypothetical protein
VFAVLVLALVFSQTCQRSNIRVTDDQAIATAKREISFKPTRTQVRLVRQGIQSKPFWVVSLSVPIGDFAGDRFSKLALVKIDANSGKVVEVDERR